MSDTYLNLNEHEPQNLNALDPTLLNCFVDRCEWTYWDTVFASASDFPRFTVPFSIGRWQFDPIARRPKTLHDTNMISSGVQNGFGATRCMILQEMGVYFPLWMPDQSINRLLSACSIVFSIAEKVFYESRLDFREEKNEGGEIVNTYTDGREERFCAPEFSGRMVRIRAKHEYAKYIAPLIPFTFRIDFNESAAFDFDGVKPIMIPMISGLTDRAVQ
jgi:hypothetical protein